MNFIYKTIKINKANYIIKLDDINSIFNKTLETLEPNSKYCYVIHHPTPEETNILFPLFIFYAFVLIYIFVNLPLIKLK